MHRRLPLALALLLCACDESSPPDHGSGDTGDRIALSDLCTAWGEAYCRAAVVCGTVVESQAPACARVRASACDQERAVALVEAGHVAYDGAAYRRCLVRFAAAPECDREGHPALAEDDADCRAAAVGQVEESESCGAAGFGPLGSRECAGGRCHEAGCDGYCVSVPGPGDECTGPCAPGYRCLDWTCRPLGAEGEACSVGRDDCAAGLFCHPAEAGSGGTCLPPLAAGAPCDAYEDRCVAGAYCPEVWGGGVSACTARGAEGEPCVSGGCRPGLFCPPIAPAACTRQQPPGGPCLYADECLEPATCDPETGLCALRPIVGEPCSGAPGTPGVCATGWCDGATCRAKVPNGEPCTHDDACVAEGASCLEGRCYDFCEG